MQLVTTAFSASPYLASTLWSDPSLLYWLFEGKFLNEYSDDDWEFETMKACESFDTDEGFIEAINHFKMKHSFLLALREIFKMDPIQKTTQRMSKLADTILETVYRRVQKTMPECRIAIVSLGKLGGFEVNFSSDLDLIFFGESGEQSDLNAMGQKMISILTADSRFGWLFRIDMRLRPEGNTSPLVTKLAYFDEYLATRVRTWERQAYIRARFSAGDAEIGRKAMERIEDFVFHSYLTIEDIRSILSIKTEIDNSVKSDPTQHVKKGRGGIRDIEFIVQAFQLIFGKTIPALRRANIFKALEILFNLQLIQQQEYATLSGVYQTLRRIEHYLQLKDNLQVFELPKDERSLTKLARLMGYASAEEFKTDYLGSRERVRVIFTNIFTRIFGEGDIAPISEIVLNPDIERDAATELLRETGFADPRSIFEYLRYLSSISPRMGVSLALSLNLILKEVQDSHHPDKKFFRFFSILERYGATATFLKLIRYDDALRSLLLVLLAESQYLTDIVLAYPGLLDRFIDPDALDETVDCSQWFGAFQSEKPGATTENLARLMNSQMLNAAMREYANALTSEQTGHILSDSADFVIRTVCESAEKPPVKSYAVLALGRLGCREITFGSDADVNFLYYDMPDKKSLYSDFFQELIQTLAPVMELDARLRPDGRNSALTMSGDDFDDYLHSKAEFWEKVAYAKTRVIVGKPAKSAEATMKSVRRFVLTGDIRRDFDEVMDLRGKIHSAYSKSGEFNIKKDVGGLMDIDFILFMKLRRAKAKEFSVSPLENLRLLDEKRLLEVYQLFRATENALRMTDTKLGSALQWNDEILLRSIAKKVKIPSGKTLSESLETARATVESELQGLKN